MHLEQACNLSNALGQGPRLTGKAAPSFPGLVPFSMPCVWVTLGPATDAQIGAFMDLELPTWEDPYDSPDVPPQDDYETIGEFYHSLRFGLREVYGEGCEPWPLGVNAQVFGSFGDDGFPITSFESAVRALDSSSCCKGRAPRRRTPGMGRRTRSRTIISSSRLSARSGPATCVP